MRKNSFKLFAIIIVALTSCHNPTQPKADVVESTKEEAKVEPTEVSKFVQSIEAAHKKEVFSDKQAIQFDLMLSFGGKSRFDGTITMTPNGNKIKMEGHDMATMIWDGEKAMIAPSTSNEEGARFALFTWSYFFAASYKLSDPGTQHEFLGVQPLNDKNYTASRLTFEEGIGDSSDDWYIVYREDSSNVLAAMAYIVTAGTSKAAAEEDPHAITYEAYTEIDGIPFATVWNFWKWTEDGKMETLLGNASVKNIQFVEIDENLFEISNKEAVS